MYNNILLSRYFPVKSRMHQTNPFSKMLCTLIFIVILIIANSPAVMATFALVTLIMILRSNVPIRLYAKSVSSLTFIILIVLVMLLLLTSNYLFILFVIVKIVLIVLYTSILTYTSTPTEITYGFQKLLAPLKLLGFPTSKMALELTMAIRYIPILMDQAERLTKTAASRGVDYINSDIIGKIKTMFILVEPLFRLANKRSRELLISMEIRMYTVYNKRTNYRTKLFSFNDVTIIVLHLLILGLYIYKEVQGVDSILDHFFV